MAYVVARPKGRFEIRESVHTPEGAPGPHPWPTSSSSPTRSSTRRRRRASRPFDLDAVRAVGRQGRRAAAARRPGRRHSGGLATPRRRRDAAVRRVLAPDGCRRSSRARRRPARHGIPATPSSTCSISSPRSRPSRPPRRPEPLRFPPLARLRAAHRPGLGPTRAPLTGPNSSAIWPQDHLAARDARLRRGAAPVRWVPSPWPGTAIPRATTDIDVNLTAAARGRRARSWSCWPCLGVTVTPEDRAAIAGRRAGEARLGRLVPRRVLRHHGSAPRDGRTRPRGPLRPGRHPDPRPRGPHHLQGRLRPAQGLARHRGDAPLGHRGRRRPRRSTGWATSSVRSPGSTPA